MAHLIHRHGHGSANYYEAEKEVVRGPCDSYSSEYKVQEYGNPGYLVPAGHHHHHHNPGYTDRLSEVVSYEANPGSYIHHHHHGRPDEYIERREAAVYENAPYNPCRRAY